MPLEQHSAVYRLMTGVEGEAGGQGLQLSASVHYSQDINGIHTKVPKYLQE